MPFGITSAPEHFQKRISKILNGLDGVLGLIDDILIFGKDTSEHDQRLESAMTRIQNAGVTLNAKKCAFRQTQLKFLGHIVDKDGIRADPDKTKAILEMEIPANVSELRRFMGMVNHLGSRAHTTRKATP